MIAIIDYGVGNLFSLTSSLNSIGADIVITNDAVKIKKCDKIILPGVGAFEDAIGKLKKTGLDEVLIDEAKNGKPILGICLGMQLLFEKSYEYGCFEGLGLIKGEVTSLKGYIDDDLKIPHMGWNALNFPNGQKDELFKYINEGDYVYFVHSYHGVNTPSVIATSNYSYDVCACVRNKNVFGCQFHPEKSGDVGLNILRAYCEM